MLSWNIWYSDLLSHWVSDISTYLIFCLVWRSVNLWICWAETSDLLIYWVSEFSAHMIFWNTGSLTFLKVCRSVDMLGWNLWHSDLLSHWVSEISAYMVFWQTGSLTFLKFWAETAEIFSEITVYMIFWYTGSLIWRSGDLRICWAETSDILVFWFSDVRKGQFWSFWASVYVKVLIAEKFQKFRIFVKLLMSVILPPGSWLRYVSALTYLTGHYCPPSRILSGYALESFDMGNGCS